MVNLFCFKYQKKEKKVTKKDAKLKHCCSQKLLHLPVYLKLLPRCASHSSRCWHWRVMCRLKELVCFFFFSFFFSSSVEWNRQFNVKSLSERAVSYHFILPCSGSQALKSQPLQALLAFGGWAGDRDNLSVISWPAPCSIYRRQEWLEAMLYSWLLFFSGRQFSSRGAGPCSVILCNPLTLYPTLHRHWRLFSVSIWKKEVVKSGCIWVSCNLLSWPHWE